MKLTEETGDSWSYTFENLPKYAGTTTPIVYTVDETEVPTGYTKTLSDDKLTVTNTHTPEVIDVKVIKVWNDVDNQDGMRPDSIEVTLSNGQKVTLNEENEWTATLENLPVYENGEKIAYTWTENIVDGYELTTEVDETGYITTLTNTHEPELISITVTKVWADDDNESGKRPESITITLFANGNEYETITITEGDNWKHTFEKLDAYKDGEKITYTVVENDVPDGYEVAYEGDMDEGFIIHNVLGQGGEEPPVNPQTADNIFLYLITLLISIIGIVSGKLYIKKFN